LRLTVTAITPNERIWNGFIDDAKAAIEREKQALSIANVVGQSEQILAWERWRDNKYAINKRSDFHRKRDIDSFLSQ
jgi:hypothetical protein